MSSDALKAMEEAGEAMGRAIRVIRRIWETEAEMVARIHAEVWEEFQPEAPSHHKARGYDWRADFIRNWLPWGGRRDRRRRRR